MTHNLTKLPHVKGNKSHVKHILLYMCQICLTIFLTHGVPNTPQVKPTEDNCEVYFTQHVSNVTLCRCQIYSVQYNVQYMQRPRTFLLPELTVLCDYTLGWVDFGVFFKFSTKVHLRFVTYCAFQKHRKKPTKFCWPSDCFIIGHERSKIFFLTMWTSWWYPWVLKDTELYVDFKNCMFHLP
jgi:hypothetical protein